jgi:dienelactone hydrolase
LTAWSAQLAGRGYVVLMLDSFTPREQGQMCSQQGFRLSVFRDRPSDAYSALRWLQSQPFVRPDRVGVMGWSEGGGVVLMSIGARSLGRPDTLPDGDFRAAVAFYPASCDERKLGGLLGASPAWSSTIPLLVLVGDGDVWTPAGPCRALLDGARSRGTPAEMHIYPGAFHDFDWPNIPVRERPEFITKSGTVPITGTNPDARADALERVPAFLATYLGK